jgi:hypothetical protein
VLVPDHPTQVMPLDELMDLAAEPRDDTATMPIATTPSPALAASTRTPAPLNPATPRATPRPTARPTARPQQPQPRVDTGPDLRDRVMADARRAYEAGLAQGRGWLKRGDNALIAATLAVTLVLLLVVGAV